MIPPFPTNWGVMSNVAPADSLKGKCLCGCHSKREPRPDADRRAAWCEPCLEERNQPWTTWVESIL